MNGISDDRLIALRYLSGNSLVRGIPSIRPSSAAIDIRRSYDCELFGER